ncbi:MAG: acyltransferase family protein, partial [Smithellaceae bacterium]
MDKSERYLALDVLRGMTIAFMILVNTPGSWQYIYPPLKHAEWHGCTPTDLVFPFFLFIMGISIFFSFEKYQNAWSKESLLRVGRRTLLIFVIGVFINSYPQWMTDYSQLRIMGVLQRIAVAYGIAALIVLSAPRKWLSGIGAFILLVYWGILYFCGGLDPYSLQENVIIPFDRAIMGENHLYRGFGIPFDPEGILSSLPSVVTVIIGYLAGIMIKETDRNRVPVKLVLYGTAFTITGYLWGLVFPLNKPLWTSSYVLFTAGLAFLLFAYSF